MGDGLARVLSKQDFNAEAFVKKQTTKTNSLNNVEGLLALRQDVGHLREETSVALKKNVYKHYSQFIETAKEISILEADMYQLSHLLTEQKNVMTNMMELSLTGGKVDTDGDPETSKQMEAFGSKISLSFLLEKVEGCSSITDVPGRTLIHNGDVVEVDVDSFSQIQKVHLFLLSDSLLVTLWLPERKGPVRYRYQTLYELDGLAVVNVRDTGHVRNAFKILMFPDTRIFMADSPKAKRQWLDLLEETKRNKSAQESHKRKLEEEATPIPLPRRSSKQATEKLSSSVLSASPVRSPGEADFLRMEWVRELPEDLDVCIAQRDFEGAVDLILKINKHLTGCHRNVSVSDYKSRIDHRVKQLTEVLTQELKLSPERSIRGGPRSARRAVTQLIRLGKSIQACELFLKNRSAISHYGLRQLKTESNTSLYVSGLCKMFFNTLVEISREFLKAFPNHSGCFSAFILWCRDELKFFVNLFTSQVFDVKSNFSTVALCVAEARRCCETLNEGGLDLMFVLDRFLNEPLLNLMQQAGDNQMDAIRHRAVDDQWRPVNFQSAESLKKFEDDMKSIGFVDVSDYSYNTCFSYLTTNTVQFSRSYRSFSCDLLHLYEPDMRRPIVDGLKDIFNAQVQHIIKSVESKEFRDALPLIRKNAAFLGTSLLLWVKQRHLEIAGFPLVELDDLFELLKRI